MFIMTCLGSSTRCPLEDGFRVVCCRYDLCNNLAFQGLKSIDSLQKQRLICIAGYIARKLSWKTSCTDCIQLLTLETTVVGGCPIWLKMNLFTWIKTERINVLWNIFHHTLLLALIKFIFDSMVVIIYTETLHYSAYMLITHIKS